MFRKSFILLALCLMPLIALSAAKQANKPKKVNAIENVLVNHFQTYHQLEYFSAIQVSIKIGDKLKTYVVGHRSHDKKVPITANDLFQIGSITKSFTAALTLLAEAKGQLAIEKPVKTYLNAYPHWDNLSLASLLNMTSGLPNYSDSPKMNIGYVDNIKRFWNRTELIDLVYVKNYSPPLRQGYDYTNTGYILVDMILTGKGQSTLAQLLEEQIIKPLGLKNTFYPIPSANTDVSKRLISGYAYNVYVNPELVGQDVRENNLSWAGAAGGIVANSEDVVRWVDALFLQNNLLSKEQKAKMQSLVSVKTGKPIKEVNWQEPRGFGLGIIQAYDKRIGRYWFYEGETLGYRAIYMVVPCNKVIISALFNSATNGDNDKSGELMMSLYKQVLSDNPKLENCRS
ncbi:serine hydrolase domain-containing protein [Legionella sp. W05-934-2]|uniref:serine hydrolase domain-containing protein n=1 Tax=Legionella sp. W05-934-2 TaxID=1198649 RepID=UPI003462929F